ncbi:hypothetical protein H4CHR_05481 [Variovorax sp. PBS-H4]|nr:hypothetical protein H4CHR_05481 [Variovorax sp. PBS-H4]
MNIEADTLEHLQRAEVLAQPDDADARDIGSRRRSRL